MFKQNQKLVVSNNHQFYPGRTGYFQELVNEFVVLSMNIPGNIGSYSPVCYFVVNKKYIQDN